MAIAERLKKLAPYAPALGLAALAVFIAWAFAATTLSVTRPMGLPLDDSYIYLTYAKQFGRGQPFTYFPGGGYSAGSTSVLWPMLLAPFWTLGARGHALVWVSFGMGAACFTMVGLGCYRFVRKLAASETTGVIAGALAISIAPFAWSALSGMEVGFAAALLVATLLLLVKTEPEARPSWALIVVLAATSLSRPEATLIVSGIVGVAVIARARKRLWRPAAWWLVPLVAPLLWVTANKLFAGNFFPNTGVVKSHFYLPGFDWTYWRDAVGKQLGLLMKTVFWDGAKSPLVMPKLVSALMIAGAIRTAWWAHREKRYLVGGLVIGAPFLLMFAVVCTSGVGGWSFQNYRYVATAFPLLFILVALALAPPRGLAKKWQLPWAAGACVPVAIYLALSWAPMRDEMLLFAQGAMDTNGQVVTIGHYIHDKLPDARIMFHDAGAISYYGDGAVYDMLGLVTNYQAGIANNGPGSRFEFLESLPPERRPTHFAYYPPWLGTAEFFGDVLLHTSLRPGLPTKLGRLVGEADMQVIAANWDHVGTGERPLNDHTGWAVVDRVDIADLASERAHAWVGRLGRRTFGDPTARWSFVERELLEPGLVLDGGRTIRDGGEAFDLTADPAKPTRIVIRTGGQPGYPPWQETLTKPITLELFTGTKSLGHLTVAAPTGTFSELTFNLPPHALPSAHARVHAEATGPYRVFHWFVLQPESP